MADFRFGAKSLRKLDTCCPQLKAVATRAIELTPVDFTIIHGFRSAEEQDLLFESGASKTPWPKSKHNNVQAPDQTPWSLALDFGPLHQGAIPWGDTHMFALVAGVFFSAAKERGVTLRWGGDWDMDGSTEDQTFMDWGHLEVVLDE